MWRVVECSGRGTSHKQEKSNCQDWRQFRHWVWAGEPVLLIAIADGAGSAKRSQLAAAKATAFLLKQARHFDKGADDLDPPTVLEWFQRASEHLKNTAAEKRIPVEDFACTLLFAVLGERSAVFAQLGDGAWIAKTPSEYRCMTWPTKGEYANQTVFLTSSGALGHLQLKRLAGVPIGVAGFTDGLETSGLNFETRTPHAPFFDPMFGALAKAENEDVLTMHLKRFLDSDLMNKQTDDDKTLVLACHIT